MGNGCVAEDLALRQGAGRENILHGSLTDEQCCRSAKGSRLWSTAILAVGPAGILPVGSRLAGETPASPTGWKPVPRREAAKSKRGARQVPDAASIELLSIVCYSGGPPNLTVTSLEQLPVPASHTL